ncbi:hypothetical protein BC832DRAFT_618530 [Gaertneriomyces semiglobifer]|nr:hypothetical protein BC832DRAFT_618530 [Gaertneriomyces semiglobifer]
MVRAWKKNGRLWETVWTKYDNGVLSKVPWGRDKSSKPTRTAKDVFKMDVRELSKLLFKSWKQEFLCKELGVNIEVGYALKDISNLVNDLVHTIDWHRNKVEEYLSRVEHLLPLIPKYSGKDDVDIKIVNRTVQRMRKRMAKIIQRGWNDASVRRERISSDDEIDQRMPSHESTREHTPDLDHRRCWIHLVKRLSGPTVSFRTPCHLVFWVKEFLHSPPVQAVRTLTVQRKQHRLCMACIETPLDKSGKPTRTAKDVYKMDVRELTKLLFKSWKQERLWKELGVTIGVGLATSRQNR